MEQAETRSVRPAEILRQAPPAEALSGVLTDYDTQLMVQLRAGNVEAGSSLVRRNFERVARYVARVVRQVPPVEDLTQDVFLQVFKAAPTYQPHARFSTWLYAIATNTARNYLARQARDRRRPLAEEGEEPQLPSRRESAPDQQLNLDELRNRVSDALSRLPVNQRIALTLVEYEELSYEQVADVLDTTVEAVRSLLRRARESLRPMLTGLI